jgi:hypothetical protein
MGEMAAPQHLTGELASPDALFALAEAAADAGEVEKFEDAFQRAYLAAPLFAQLRGPLAAGPSDDALRRLLGRLDALLARGVLFTTLLTTKLACEARLGNAAAVRRLTDPRYLQQRSMAPPPGWSAERFHATLADEVKTKLRHYDEADGWAIIDGARHNHLTESGLPASTAFIAAVRSEVEAYIAALPAGSDEPFVRARPERYEIRGWGVVSNGASYHKPHIHPRAWLSGVYYVVQPPVSKAADERRGWLRVGPPDAIGLTPASGWEERLFQPAPGNLVLLPAYYFHNTRPMGVDEERICIAFDVMPART